MQKNLVWIALGLGFVWSTLGCENISRTPTAPTPPYSSGITNSPIQATPGNHGPLDVAGIYDGVVTLGESNVGCHTPITFVVELTQNGASVNASVLYGTTLLVWHGSIPNHGTTLHLTFTPGVNVPFRCNLTNWLASGASFVGVFDNNTITGAGTVTLMDDHHEIGVIYATAVLTKR